MPISFGTNTIDLARWIYIPDEIIDFEPYINVRVLGIVHENDVNTVSIPSLKMFTNVSMLTIYHGVGSVTEYPDNLKSLWLFYTNLTTLSNIPETVDMISLTQNTMLSIDKLPVNLVSLAGYGQHFDDIVITPMLSKLSLYRCSFSRIFGIDTHTLGRMDVLYIMSCKSPYPDYVVMNGHPVGVDVDSISIVEYSNIIQKINRNIYISRCIPMADLQHKCLSYTPSSTNDITNGMRAIMLQSNYARRITEFLG